MEEKNVRYIRSLASHSGEPAGVVMQKSTIARRSEDACAFCGGSGWRQVSGAATQQVVRCECFANAQVQALARAAEIPARYADCNFASYKAENSQALGAAKITLQKWAAEYPLNRAGLLLIGPSGVGKTHLAVAALKEVIKKGLHARFCDYRELLKQIQNSYNASVQATELEVLRPVFEAEVLLLDDLGAVKPSEWVWDTVSLVLNTRYNNNLTTIITTNFMDGPAAGVGAPRGAREETLGDRIGERMRSRLFEMCRSVQVVGKDYRPNFRTAGLR
jgi:DNA replication protein DnaC